MAAERDDRTGHRVQADVAVKCRCPVRLLRGVCSRIGRNGPHPDPDPSTETKARVRVLGDSCKVRFLTTITNYSSARYSSLIKIDTFLANHVAICKCPLTVMSHASSSLRPRGSMEMFDELQQLQDRISSEFDRYDARQLQFKKKFARETRKYSQFICDNACSANASSFASSAGVLFEQVHDERSALHADDGSDRRASPAECADSPSRRAQLDANAARVRDGLKCFYVPPDMTTDILCDVCHGFRSASLAHPLPFPWKEFLCDISHKHYYYDASRKVVRWVPPDGAHDLSLAVFEHTNSVFTICSCIPSPQRRRRMMEKLRSYALETARMETETRDRQLRGAFRSLTMTVIQKNTEANT